MAHASACSGELQFAVQLEFLHFKQARGEMFFVAQALLPAAPRLISAHPNLFGIPDATHWFFTPHLCGHPRKRLRGIGTAFWAGSGNASTPR